MAEREEREGGAAAAPGRAGPRPTRIAVATGAPKRFCHRWYLSTTTAGSAVLLWQ